MKRLLQKRLLHALPSQGNNTKASLRWWPGQGEASLCPCQTSLVSSPAQQQVCAECAGLQSATPQHFGWKIELRASWVWETHFVSTVIVQKEGQGKQHQKILPWCFPAQYDFFFMEPFPRPLQNKLELITNLCVPIHMFCGQECFISIIQTLFIWLRRWTKSTQWNAFVAVDQHVRLTHILPLDFTPHVSSQLLCESLTLNLSRVSRLQV